MKELKKYYFVDVHKKNVDGFDNSLFQGRTRRQVQQSQIIGVVSILGMVVTLIIVGLIKLL